MRIFLTIIFLLLLSVFFTFIILRGHNRFNEIKSLFILNYKNLPNFRFESRTPGKVFTNYNIKKGSSILIIYFSPDCEHCQYEATQIRNNIRQFDSTEILMITRSDAATTEQFARDYGLLQYPNVYFLLDHKDQFYQTFGTRYFPSIFIYNREHKLVKKFIGETKMEAIIAALRDQHVAKTSG